MSPSISCWGTRALSEQIKTQLAGEPVTEEVLQTPVVELLPEGEAESEE